MSDSASDFGTTLTGGIQDISGLLPLLGTEQCEKHVGSALEKGYLYASAAPLSIFGSLGIIQSGTSDLKGNGLEPEYLIMPVLNSGSVAPLIGVDSDSGTRFKAESRLEQILDEKHIENPEDLLVKSTYLEWSLGLIVSTIFIAGIGVIDKDLTASISLPWTYPFLRVVGSCVASVCTQFIIQSRIISIIKNRIIFIAMNNLIRHPDSLVERNERLIWSTKSPSEECLWSLEQLLRTQLSRGLPRKPANDPEALCDPNTTRPPRIIVFGPQPVNDPQLAHDPQPTLKDSDAKEILMRLKDFRQQHFPNSSFDRLFITASWIVLLAGIFATIVGYVGCFTLVTNSRQPNGPLIWLGLEVTLSLLRIILWAWNPSFDEKTKVTVELKLSEDPPLVTTDKDVRVLDTTRTLDLIPENKFLEWISPFTGPLERFNGSDNIVLYFTLSGDRHRGLMSLYMTVFDIIKRTAFTVHHAFGTNKMVYSGEVATDTETGEMIMHMEDSPLPMNATTSPLSKSLFEYYSSLLQKLSSRNFLVFAAYKTSTKLEWKWSLQPIASKTESPSPNVTSPPLTMQSSSYLQRGYEHHLKTKLMENWGRWVIDSMEAMCANARYDCRYTLAGPTSPNARWELEELDKRLLFERTERELDLISYSMRAEDILQGQMQLYVRAFIKERAELEKHLWLQYKNGLTRRLKHEGDRAKERMEQAKNAWTSRAQREGQLEGGLLELWKRKQGLVEGSWKRVIEQAKLFNFNASGPFLSDTQTVETPLETQEHEYPGVEADDRRVIVVKTLSPKFAHWSSQRQKEKAEAEESIRRIKTLSAQHQKEILEAESDILGGGAYNYPDSSKLASKIHSRFIRLSGLSVKEARFILKHSSPTVYDVKDCTKEVIYNVINNSTVTTVINIPADLEIVQANTDLLSISGADRQVRTSSSIQENHERWWMQQTENSSTFYFSPERIDEYFAYNRQGTIAHIMIFLAEPAHVRLRLAHFRKMEASISIQEKGASRAWLPILPDDIAENKMALQGFELGSFDRGRHELELVVNAGHGRYCLRDVLVEFCDGKVSEGME